MIKQILVDCNKWTNLKAKFMAMESVISDIKALSNVNPVILNYVMEEVTLFVTTHHSTIDDEIR